MTAPVDYVPHFLSPEDAGPMFEALRGELAWERRVGAPRSEYWTNPYHRPYTYGKGDYARTYESRPGHPAITKCRLRLSEQFRAYLEGCFLNWYTNEQDHLGWHADDDDPGIDHSRPIAVITLGNARDLQTRYRFDAYRPHDAWDDPLTFTLEPGSLLLMRPGMQQTHQHRVRKGSRQGSERISLTFRGLLP
jgi:alkylated DNA repair dioxygenase AlkB